MTNLTEARFNDPDAAREYLEGIRWPDGPFCPHCGSFAARRLPDQRGKPSKKNPEGSIRKGVIQCNDCRQQYTVTVGTVFGDSKIPLHKWMLANHLMVASKKGISAHQLHRMLGITYKSAWFMAHRIREAMTDTANTPMGGGGGTVEVDETFIGREPGVEKKAGGAHHKMKVLSMVDRDTKRVRSFVVDDLTVNTIWPILAENIRRDSRLMTDEAHRYKQMGREYSIHAKVNHGDGEYVNLTDRSVHTNTIESYFSTFKRGMKGVYQHCAKKHLHRYLVEFDFRYSNRAALEINDDMRADIALKGIEGKRLTYRRINQQAA